MTTDTGGAAIGRQHWDQLKTGSLASLALAVLAGAWALLPGHDAGLSALLGVGVVWVSFGASAVIMAVLAPRLGQGIVFAGIAVYVLKVFVVAILVLTLSAPGWLRPVPAVLAAGVAVLMWQAVAFRAVARSRVLLFDSPTGDSTPTVERGRR
ncbi:hypothetical protein [Falsarthrobacter nasiphocae]|uniref:ATP synthase protein I n=1 Tax=Falsarthrobacter nasiphocae TaxID=189863 RepID=A0AAE3YHF6_9MICC|nr:hypothetical protein [Falsarthrobacter nasiphocae]MDR6892772.1 hypothetical protein [Falsarthrobacter nasiphocae]